MNDFSPNNPIRAISFDLDDTLWDNRPVLLAAEQKVCDWLTEHYPRIGEDHDCHTLRAQRMTLAESRPDLRHDMTRLRKESLRLLAKAYDYDLKLVEEAFEVFIEARHRITLFDDVIPVLQALRTEGYLLGAVTNGNASIYRLGIDHLFDFSVSAEEAGAAKPDPHMFQIACERSGVQPEEMAYVGDEPTTDIQGAHNAGTTTIWMNRTRSPWPDQPPPDFEVADMHELLAVVRCWQR
jgi:putative hydrolase of the HAD superfamily